MSTVIDHAVLDSELSSLCSAGHWYVGFSGGVDSTALLHLIHSWCKANPGAPPLTAIHINHSLQEQADDWETHCAWICKFLQLPVITIQVQVDSGSKGLEAAAREQRYREFEQRLQEGDILFLGHHLDDQVETFFLRLMRGAGVQGLAAMPHSRKLGRGKLVRPLLGTTRCDLEAYADQYGLECIEDPSNLDSKQDRNFLRRQLLPQLAGRWPGYRQTVSRASEHMAVAVEALEEGVVPPLTRFSVLGDPGVPQESLSAVAAASAAMALRGWLRDGGYQAPDQLSLIEFLRQLRESGPQARPRLQTSEYTLQRYLDTVFLLPPSLEGSLEPLFLSPGDSVQLPGVGVVSLKPSRGEGLWLAADEELELRWRSGGERCRPVGRAGSSSLKKLLQEHKLPPWWRDRVPLLYLSEELLAVGELWCCQSSRYGDSGRGGERCYQLCWQPTIRPGFD